jgi:hypothetical protein
MESLLPSWPLAALTVVLYVVLSCTVLTSYLLLIAMLVLVMSYVLWSYLCFVFVRVAD